MKLKDLKKNELFSLWLRRKKMNQRFAAVKFGVSQGLVSSWANGFRTIPDEVMAVLDVEVPIEDHEEFWLRLRRMGMNMTLACERLRIEYYLLLAFLRGKYTIPVELWAELKAIEKREQNKFK